MIRLSEEIWNENPEFRSHFEWGLILESLRGSLAEFLDLPVTMVDYWTDNGADDRSWSICGRIRAIVSEPLRSCFVGSLCMSLNRGESVRISADLLYFAGGVRHAAHPLSKDKGKDVFVLNFIQHPCSIGRWTGPVLEVDGYAEWEAFQTIEDLDVRY
jgi:hypothetical protein